MPADTSCMAWGKTFNEAAIASQARKAAQSGERIFTPRMLQPTGWAGVGQVIGWAETIAEVEAAGWQLVHWSVAAEGRRLAAYPVFRR